MKISRTYLLWTLGLLTAFGPYITDLYLSSLPEQVEYFGTTPLCSLASPPAWRGSLSASS